MLLAGIYKRNPVWRLGAVGQGYNRSPDALVRGDAVVIGA